MSNTILTPTAVTRKALAILHQKITFIGSINRQYDESFAKSGAKIGDSLKIRLPNQYTVRTGAALSTQDVTESSVTLQVATQKGVDVTFTSAELALSLDDFADRILEPAMSVLAAHIEADALTMYKDVYNLVDGDAAAISFLRLMQGRQRLNDELAPAGQRTALLSTAHTAVIVDALKGMFNPQEGLAKQWREGAMGRTGGFDFSESSLVADHTTGDAAKTTTLTVNGADQTGASITVANAGGKTFKQGDVITFAGCYRVHPETKTSTGSLQQFVVTADASSTTLTISPAIVTSGATQNVSASLTNGGAVVKVGAGASELLNSSMVYHRDAFAFATADLPKPDGVDFAAREVFDGLSLRIVRQYAIATDTFPCRIDILYGKKAIRPQLACRIHADG